MATCYDCFHWKACRNILESMNPDLKGKKINILSTCEKFTPTTDVVKVVRCKDCIYAEESTVKRPVFCNKIGIYNGKYDFCSYGEREKGR